MAYTPTAWSSLVEITSARLNNAETGIGAAWRRWTGTQAEYDALGSYDPTVLYAIAGFNWLVADDFAATEAPPALTDTGQSWRVESGTWSQSAGTLTASADGAVIVAPVGATTQTAEVLVGGTVAASSVPTIVLAYDNSNDWHYRIEKVNTSELRCVRRDPNSTTVWTTATGVFPGAGAKVRVSVTGPAGARVFRLWVNDSEVTTLASGSFTDTDATPPLGTEAGLRWAYTSTGNAYNYQSFRATNSVAAP